MAILKDYISKVFQSNKAQMGLFKILIVVKYGNKWKILVQLWHHKILFSC